MFYRKINPGKAVAMFINPERNDISLTATACTLVYQKNTSAKSKAALDTAA